VKWTECNQYQGHKYAGYKQQWYTEQEGSAHEEVNRYMTTRLCKHLKNSWFKIYFCVILWNEHANGILSWMVQVSWRIFFNIFYNLRSKELRSCQVMLNSHVIPHFPQKDNIPTQNCPMHHLQMTFSQF
jgi:hypothetical protein